MDTQKALAWGVEKPPQIVILESHTSKANFIQVCIAKKF